MSDVYDRWISGQTKPEIVAISLRLVRNVRVYWNSILSIEFHLRLIIHSRLLVCNYIDSTAVWVLVRANAQGHSNKNYLSSFFLSRFLEDYHKRKGRKLGSHRELPSVATVDTYWQPAINSKDPEELKGAGWHWGANRRSPIKRTSSGVFPVRGQV